MLRPYTEQDLGGEGEVEDGDFAVLGERGEGELDVGAGGVAAGVEDAGRGVGALAGEGDLAVLGVERHAEAHEVVDAVGGLGGEDAGGLAVYEAGAGGDRVVEVLLGGVARPDGRGDAALRPARVAVVNGALGDDEHGAVLAGEEGGVQPGDAGADDDVVVALHGPKVAAALLPATPPVSRPPRG